MNSEASHQCANQSKQTWKNQLAIDEEVAAENGGANSSEIFAAGEDGGRGD